VIPVRVAVEREHEPDGGPLTTGEELYGGVVGLDERREVVRAHRRRRRRSQPDVRMVSVLLK
jgi:hypothetical protein